MLRTVCSHLAPDGTAGASAAAGACGSDRLAVREELRSEPLHLPPPPATVPEMAAKLISDGFLHLPACLSSAETARLRERSDALWRQWVGSSKRAFHAVCGSSYDPEFLLPLDKEPTCAVAGEALGPGFALFGDSVWNNYERPAQQLHIDYQQYEARVGDQELTRELAPLRFITAHYYLDNVYEELGPTKFIAQSHVAGRPPLESDRSSFRGMPDQSVLVNAGDCVLFRSDVPAPSNISPRTTQRTWIIPYYRPGIEQVWHRGGGNTSGEPRHIIQVHYCDAWAVELFQEGWDEERVQDAAAKQEAAFIGASGGRLPNPDAVMKGKLCVDPPEFTYPKSSWEAASTKQRALIEPVLATGAAYQQVKSAVMRAELRRIGKSSAGSQQQLVDRLNGRVE